MLVSEKLNTIGRPATYYPNLAKLLGLKESVFLCNLLYWTGKQSDPEGWIYKTQDEIFDETGLSLKEQRRVRKQLLSYQVLEERENRIQHRIYYKVDVLTLLMLWRIHSEDPILQDPEGPSPDCPLGSPRSDQRSYRLYTSSTSSTTTSEGEAPSQRVQFTDYPETTETTESTMATPLLVKPTLEEVKLQGQKIGLPDIECEKFFNHYSSNGWKVGKNPMTSFTHALANWKINWMQWRGLGSSSTVLNGNSPADRTIKSKELERVIQEFREAESEVGTDALGTKHYRPGQWEKIQRLKTQRDKLRRELGL